MKTITKSPREYEFCFPYLDTLILVEVMDDRLIIRATRNTFSEERKIRFIRQLAAEGFIPDSYRWFSGSQSGEWLPISWNIDYSWLQLNPEQKRRTSRIMTRTLIGAAVLWLALMCGAFVHALT